MKLFPLGLRIVSVAFVCIISLIYPTHFASASMLLEDDFSGDNPEKWDTFNSNSWSIQDGKYGLDNTFGSGVTNSFPKDQYWDHRWENISYEIDVVSVSGLDKNVLVKYVDPQNFIEIHHSVHTLYLVKYSQSNGTQILGSTGLGNTHGVTYKYKTILDGNNIKVYLNDNLLFDVVEPSPLFNSWRIGMRVGNAEVWYDNVLVTSLDNTEPDPDPDPQPDPEVSNVVLIPGFGGSWNTDAILNCKASGYEGGWELSPIAQEIYSPILTALEGSGSNIRAFYYDWRRPILHNKDKVTDFITNSYSDDKKVNIVGHSMGGLVGRAFLEKDQGIKLHSLYTVGSPHKGTPLAYPTWSGGDVWNSDLIARIATTLLIKRCGALKNSRELVQENIPSVQDLLPIEDYLIQRNHNLLKAVDDMHAQNQWLPTSAWESTFYGVKVGSLAGTGFETLTHIPVVEQNRHDKKLGNWLDGKPAGKVFTTNGDGTVTTNSSLIPDAENDTINQTHTGLISSNEGIERVLHFLGLPTTIQHVPTETGRNAFTEPESALVILTDSADLTLKNEAGLIKQSKRGIVSLLNPQSDSYQLFISPNNDKTLLVVAQFLPNGKTLYKEYDLNGNEDRALRLHYNSDNPNENILE